MTLLVSTLSMLWLTMLCLSGCGDNGAAPAGDGCCASTADPDLWADTVWDLVPIDPLSPSLSLISTPREVLRAAGNDDVYIINNNGSRIDILTPTWTQPSGRYCVEGTSSADDCTSGILVTSGSIDVSPSPAVCLDDVDDTLLLVKDNGGRIELARTNRSGDSWATYNRAAVDRTVAKEDTDRLDGACAARAGRIALSGDNEIVLLDDGWKIASRIALAGGAKALDWVGDSGWLVAHAGNGSVWAINAEAGSAQEIVPPGDAMTLAVDPDRQVVWIARAGGNLVRLPISADGVGTLETMALCGGIQQLAVDSRTGAVVALSRCADAASGYELLVIDRHGLRASVQLEDDNVLALIPPGAMGQLSALVQQEPTYDTAGAKIPAETVVRSWAIVDPEDLRPPLSMFMVTTLEQPFTNDTMACTRSENPSTNFESYVEQLEENIPILQSLDMPVAVGVTWEFGTKARECGLDGVITDLHDAGFTLGTMVHNKPCHSCTNEDVPGETPDQCSPSDPDFSDAKDPDACWPSNEDYCTRGDNECWAAWVGSRALDVDEWISGGSQFIFGADRHRLWDWEYVGHGYRSFPRADGSTGYTISLFGGAWVYADIQNAEDPRGKDPAPWSPELLGNTWFPADVDSWESDSAFSDLLYLPGNSNALSRLYDLERSDLSLVHLIDEVNGLTVTQEDLDVVLAKVMQPAAHRTDRPGTFYFHVADLTGYPLKPAEGDDRVDQQALLLDLKARIDALYGPEGLNLVKWQGPLDVRADMDAWLETH